MAIKCPQCGTEYDVTLFTFGRKIHCDCGAWVDLDVGHQQSAEDSEQASQRLIRSGSTDQGHGSKQMKVGDWVFFKTHNWPKDVRHTSTDSATGDTKDIPGQGLYEGRGKIIGVAGDNYTVREEKTNRLVEVGPNPEDVIRPLGFEYATLTLGNLREFLERYKDAPNDIPVTLALPLGFFSDEDDLPADHPEYRAVSAFQSVSATGIAFMAYSDGGEMVEGYIPPDNREGEEWDFSVEIMPNDEQCFEAMRERDNQ